MDIQEIFALGRTIDSAQAYFMAVAKLHNGEITLTFKIEEPYVTVFLGVGSEAKIGFGSGVALAMADALELKSPWPIIPSEEKT